MSSRVRSLALLRGTTFLAGETWESTWFDNQDLFRFMTRLLEMASVRLADIDVFVAGLGPGSFAGIRSAVSAARAMAIPGGTEVLGQSSGEALAFDISCESGCRTVVVMGDARRGQAWYARFERDGDFMRKVEPWALCSADSMADVVPVESAVVSPEWTRIGDRLKKLCRGSCTLVERDCFPTAASAGELALRKRESGEDAEPLVPIYLHPPVVTHGGNA